MEDIRIFSKTATQLSWQIPPEELKLENDEAHIWLARLDEKNTPELVQILSDEERIRAARFRFERDKKNFIEARGFLRIILGRYLKTSPHKLRFEYNKYGKPSIAKIHREIKFNLSHSDGLALYAVTREREIGVDLERIKPDFIEEGMVSFCLTPRETAHFQMLSETERVSFFFDCWTLKEAYLKASGDGFLIPPNQIETSLFIGYQPDFVNSVPAIRQPHFSLQKLHLIPGYTAALAVEGNKLPLKFWLLND